MRHEPCGRRRTREQQAADRDERRRGHDGKGRAADRHREADQEGSSDEGEFDEDGVQGVRRRPVALVVVQDTPQRAQQRPDRWVCRSGGDREGEQHGERRAGVHGSQDAEQSGGMSGAVQQEHRTAPTPVDGAAANRRGDRQGGGVRRADKSAGRERAGLLPDEEEQCQSGHADGQARDRAEHERRNGPGGVEEPTVARHSGGRRGGGHRSILARRSALTPPPFSPHDATRATPPAWSPGVSG